MIFSEKDVTITTTRGTGPGGRHRNSTESCIIAVHEPTGIKVKVDGRNQHLNKKNAIKQLRNKVEKYFAKIDADKKKSDRDKKIKENKYVRTYDYKRQETKNHRTGKTANLKDVLRGKLDLWEF